MKSWVERNGTLLIIASLLPGCAHIQLGPPVVTERPLDTQRVAVQEPNGFVGSADLSGSDLDVKATPACDLVDQTTVEETTVREKHNVNKAADWWIIAGSIASVAGGAGFIYEGTTTTSSPTMMMTATGQPMASSSSASPGTYYAGGVALLGIGALLATVAVYDAAKSAGSEKTVKVVKRNGEPLQKAIACPGLAASGAPVTVHLSDKEVVNVGVVSGQALRLDLDHALPERALPHFLPVFVGGTEVGRVSTSAIMKAREERAWAKLPRDPCVTPTTPSSCGPVESFIATYPDGVHFAEAKALVDAAKPTLDKLVEAQAYKDQADNLRDCQGKTNVPHMPGPGPDAMESACNSLQGFLDTYPHGAHAAEVAEVQKTGRAWVATVRKRDAERVAAMQRNAEAAQKRAQAAERAEQQRLCHARCLVGCSSHVNDSMCLAGCIQLCDAQN